MPRWGGGSAARPHVECGPRGGRPWPLLGRGARPVGKARGGAVPRAGPRGWGHPDQQTRPAMVTVAPRIPFAPPHPVLLTLRASAARVRRARRVVSRLWRLPPDAADPAGTYLLGAAATGVWAQDRSLAFLEVAVRGLRAQGRVGVLVQALVSQAWSAVQLARQSLATTAAEEAFRLASEHGMRRWAAAAQLAQAA